MNRRGFTLLELMVVVAIIALVSAAATLRMGDVYRKARLQQAEASIWAFDGRLRRLAAKRFAPLELKIEAGGRRLIAAAEGDKKEDEQSLTLPQTVTVTRAITPREDRQRGAVAVRFDRTGGSETYAVRVATPSGAERWLVFAGGSGQRIEPDNPKQSDTPKQIEELFRALAKHRFDAD